MNTVSKQTFLDLARTWKYQGISEIEFIFQPHVTKYLNEQTFITTVERLLKTDIREAEGYMAATLIQAKVKGAVTYTVGGGKAPKTELGRKLREVRGVAIASGMIPDYSTGKCEACDD